MSRYILIKHDIGNNLYKVNSVLQILDDFKIQNSIHSEITKELFEELNDILKENIVKVSKDKNGSVLNKEDLIIDNIGKIALMKSNVLGKAMSMVKCRLTFETYFNILEFILIDNQLKDHGIFITDDNREEKYLEIVNTSDEKLISILEKYITIIDSLATQRIAYGSYLTFKSDLESANTEQKIEEAFGKLTDSLD